MAEKGEACPPVHLPRDQLGLRVDALGGSVAMRERESGDDGVVVLVEAPGEGVQMGQIDCADLGDPVLMGALTRTALRSWLIERRTRWPHTLNRHVLVSRQTTNGTSPVSAYFLKRQLTLYGVSLDRIRADRVLGEALATGADPLHLTAIFDLSETTAVKYATLARQLLHDPTDQVPNLSGAE